MLTVIASMMLHGQTVLTEELPVKNQKRLDLDISFADEISIEYWSQPKVSVIAHVSINDGEADSLFSLITRSSADYLTVKMDRERWERFAKQSRMNCISSEVKVEVKMPRTLDIDAESISANFTLPYPDHEVNIKTISGDIDISMPEKSNMEFHAKTISGEVYSDLNISYPFGKEGLTQIVGMNIRGRINNGGPLSRLETISGDIFLRKN